MIAPRWRKVLGDARAARGRFIGMIVAMSISIAAVVAILSGHAVLTRELQRNFTDTNPASAEMRVDDIDESLLQQIRTRPDIVAAEASTSLLAKIEVSANEWLPIRLFVVPDFANQQITKVYPSSGRWPPPTGAFLIERSGAPLMSIAEGAMSTIELPNGKRHSLRIAGTAYDPGQAPSWQEIMLYSYITPATLKQLDASRTLDWLEIVTIPAHSSRANSTIDSIDASARDLAKWLALQDRSVQFIRIPKPGAHPHQWQIDLVVAFLFGFSVLALLLQAVLLGIIVSGMLAPQIRQIGVMKAVGARSNQIAGMYLSLIGAVAAAAVAIGLPIGLFASGLLTNFIARMLNFEIANSSVPLRTVLMCVALGLLVPLAAAFRPVWVAARRSVRDSIDAQGVTKSVAGSDASEGLTRLFTRLKIGDAGLQLGLRNTLRRRSRFTLAVVLLTLAGVVFILAGNLQASWKNVAVESAADRRFDLQINLRQDASEAKVTDIVRAVAGVRVVESSKAASALIDNGDGLSVWRADQNNLQLRSLPVPTQLLSFAMTEGRWLLPDDRDAVVINNVARAQVFPNAKIGDVVSLLVNRRPVRLRLVGVAREVFGGATGYTTPNVLDDALDAKGLTRNVGVALHPSQSIRKTIRQAGDQIQQALEREKIEVRSIGTNESINRSVTAHTYMLIAVLGIIVVSVAVVGALGLASALSTSVIERTREFGILRTIGASDRDIRKTILGEALLIGAVSWLLALVFSIPLWILVMSIVNAMSPIALTPVWSVLGVIGWLVIVLVVCAVASIVPSARAARLTIRQTLAYA